MYKKLWSADSNTWFGLSVIYSVASFSFGVALILNPSWIKLFLSLLFLVITLYPFAQFFKRRRLELQVNSVFSEMGFKVLIRGAIPKFQGQEFLGFTLDGLFYSTKPADGEYKVEELPCVDLAVSLIEYSFIDPENNFLVVLYVTEPPLKGGVQVFVK